MGCRRDWGGVGQKIKSYNIKKSSSGASIESIIAIINTVLHT